MASGRAARNPRNASRSALWPEVGRGPAASTELDVGVQVRGAPSGHRSHRPLVIAVTSRHRSTRPPVAGERGASSSIG